MAKLVRLARATPDQVEQQVSTLKRVQVETDAELKRLEQAILDRTFQGEL
jgi:type I restriction enzyme S subunit